MGFNVKWLYATETFVKIGVETKHIMKKYVHSFLVI